MSRIVHRFAAPARAATFAAIVGAALAGCSTVNMPEQGTGGVDTPVAAGVNMPAGSNEDFIVNVGRRIYFAESSADLDETARRTLDKQAEWLKAYPAYKVKIEGFADDPGTPEANRALGLKRAQGVLSYLVLQGVDARRLRAKSFGKERPVKTCPDISCWSQNRRAVTVLDTEIGA